MSKQLSIANNYRSKLEGSVAAQLEAAGIDFGFERQKMKVLIPARTATYLPDFDCPNGILLEVKGRFGGFINKWGKAQGSDEKGAEVRQKLVLLKEQYPDLDIRIVFHRANSKIYKGSKTTYGKWADDHGFLWSDKGVVPAEWIKEMK